MTRSLSLTLSLAALTLAACQTQAQTLDKAHPEVAAAQSVAEIEPCVRKIMEMDEGTWSYVGTNAFFNGHFATYETTSVHASSGPDTWSFRSFGGDTSAEEASETSYARLVGNAMIPLEDGELQEDGKMVYSSCTGPDSAGRYFAEMTYKFVVNDDVPVYVNQQTWASEHGSHFQEDLRNTKGRLLGRRSGINKPVEDEG